MSAITDNFDSNTTVLAAAFPYAVGSLALVGTGTYVAVTTLSSGGMAIPAAAAVVALMGAYGFFTTAMVGIYSKNSVEFHKAIKPALQVASFAVLTEVIALTARVVLERVITKLVFGRG